MKWLFLLLPLILLAMPVHALQNLTYTSVLDDGQAVEAAPTTNYGTGVMMQVQSLSGGNIRIFIKFDASSIPNATINSATLHLWSPAMTNKGLNYLAIYNTTLAWTEENLTWNAQPTIATLQDNLTVNTALGGLRWLNWSVTGAMQDAVKNGHYLSLEIKDSIENSTGHNMQFSTKEAANTSLRPYLEINYSVSDCVTGCGACGCIENTSQCYVPPIIGSYCDNEDGAPNTIKTVYNTTCVGTSYLVCPNGTVCDQISPLINMTVFPTTPGAANLPYCHQCVFVNMKVATAPLASTYTWVNVWTNCPDNPECNCLGWLCSNNLYEAPNITDIPYNITEWTAGCFNPSTGFFVNVTNSTGQQTTIDTLVNNSCGGNCTITNNTPQTQCPVNTTTVCYDTACNNVPCSTVVSSTCASNTGGQLALSVGGLMGITDCGLAQNILAILTSIIIGFAIMFYTKESEHSGQAFIFGTISMLVMFTLIGWFASWLMVLLIVIGAYLVAKSLGVGSG